MQLGKYLTRKVIVLHKHLKFIADENLRKLNSRVLQVTNKQRYIYWKLLTCENIYIFEKIWLKKQIVEKAHLQLELDWTRNQCSTGQLKLDWTRNQCSTRTV